MEPIDQKTGAAATVSIIAALGSYVLTCIGQPGWGLLAAIVSVPAGLIGLISAASPRVSGGILSIVAIILGALGALVSLLVFIGAVTLNVLGG